MDNCSAGYHLGTRNHLLLTAGLAVRGVVTPCAGRLADHLRTFTPPLVTVKDVETMLLPGGAKHLASEAQLPMARILLAHEYVALSGDPHLKAVHDQAPKREFQVLMTGLPGFILRGTVSNTALDWKNRFIVVNGPTAEGSTPVAKAHADQVSGLHYVLVNRDLIEALLVPGQG